MGKAEDVSTKSGFLPDHYIREGRTSFLWYILHRFS